MKRMSAPFVLLLLGAAVPAHAQHFDKKGEAARFDAAVVAGRAKAFGMAGPRTVTKAITSGCATHLIAGKEDWTIDWTTASIGDDSTASDLNVNMGPDQVFVLEFSDRAKLPAAKLAGEHLGTACTR